MRGETRCRHIGYSFRWAARVLLYASSHRQDSTYHGLCYTSRVALAGTRNSSMGPPWRIDPTTHRTMSERSYHGATSRSPFSGVMKRGSVESDFTMSIPCMAAVCVHTGLTTTCHWWHQMVQKPFGMLFQTWTRSWHSWFKVNGWFGTRRRRLSISSNRCSMGDKSGEIAGQGNVLTFCCRRKLVTTRAMRGRALYSCTITGHVDLEGRGAHAV